MSKDSENAPEILVSNNGNTRDVQTVTLEMLRKTVGNFAWLLENVPQHKGGPIPIFALSTLPNSFPTKEKEFYVQYLRTSPVVLHFRVEGL